MRPSIKLHTLTPPPALPAHEHLQRTHRATILHFPSPVLSAASHPAQPAPFSAPLETRKTVDMRREHARSVLQPPFVVNATEYGYR